MDQELQSSASAEPQPVAYKPWSPQPGPQLAAIEADWCYEILYGGARGGGKSIFLLLDFLKDVKKYGAAWQGILVRKTYPELDQIIADSWRIFAGTGAIYHKQPKTWFWPNGASLKFRNLATAEDCQAYQGHCVAKGTKILMANGAGLEIENIVVGDMVQTLSGPRRVTHTISEHIKPCVKAVSRYGMQEHPLDHAILTASGWQSAASLWGICSKGLVSTDPEFYKLQPLSVSVRCSTHRPLGPSSRNFYDAILSANRYKWIQSCFGNNHISLPLGLKKSLDWVHQFLSALLISCHRKMFPLRKNVPSCAQTVNCTTSDSQFYYRAYSHLYDELLLGQKETAPSLFPLLGDVEEPFRGHYRLDVRGNTLGDIQVLPQYEYPHPYNGQVLKGILESAFVPCEMSFVGDKAVYDLTVEEVNHYISYDTGLVNKNSYSWLAIDEMGNYSDPTVFQMMLATVRSGYANINTRVRCTANPGGQGHHWLKTRYIDPFPLGYTPFKDSPSSTRERMYIPSRITDNKILLQNDKYYIENLRSQASPELVRAWLEGDWDVQLSSFFPDFDKAKHVVRPFNIPNHWPRFRSFDWGHADPFACLWIAVADGSAVMCDDGKQLVPPKGSLIVYRELYGMELNRPNVGVRWSNERIAAAIVKATGDDQIYDTVTDSLPFQNRGGPTIAEIMFRNGVKMRFGNTDRITGWAQIHSRLAGNERGPLLYIFDTCVHLIRTLPQLQHDKHKMEDVDDGYEDHACLSGDTRVMTDIGLIKIKEIKEACVVKDWMNRRRAATAAVLTRKQAQVVRLTMSNHQTVVCTPDHRFMLQDGTMERADRLLGKTLYVSPKSSPTQNRVLGAESSINTKVNGISARDDLDCIERFGRLSMERFLKAIMFTIRTVIQLIIGWRIWSCCQPKSIISYIVKPHHNFLIPRFGRLHLAGQQNGTSQTKVERVPWQIMKSSKIGFTEKSQNSVRNVTNPLQQFQTANFVVHDASKGMQPNQGLRQDSALSVARRLRRISTAEPNLAEPYVTELVSGCESVRCVRIEKLGLEDVYCLRVPNVGHFQIEGGLVSKNCDALRLACMERPIVRTPVEEKPFHGRLTFNELIKLDELNSEDD